MLSKDKREVKIAVGVVPVWVYDPFICKFLLGVMINGEIFVTNCAETREEIKDFSLDV